MEKHNRELVPYFLTLNGENITTPSKLPKPKLIAWLTLFSKFSNPKALHATDTLRLLYVNILSYPDRSLQNLSLSCLCTYGSPFLTPYEERLRALLDEARWRDELSLLDVDDIPAAARSEVLDVIIRLLFGVMLEKKGRGRHGAAERRAAVLNFLASCSDNERGLLVDLMLRPLGRDRTSGERTTTEGIFHLDHLRTGVSDKQIVGFLSLLEDVLKNMGSKLVSYWPALLGTTIGIVATAQSRLAISSEVLASERDEDIIEEEMLEREGVVDDEMQAPESTVVSEKITRTIRHLGLKRFVDFFRIPVIFNFTPYMATAFSSFITPRLAAFDKENTQAPSALLDLFYTWTVDGIHLSFLVDFNPDALPKIYDCLSAKNVKPSVVSRVYDIIENILQSSAEDDYVLEHVLKPFVSRILRNLLHLMEETKGSPISTPLIQRQITILSEIAQYSRESEQALTLLTMVSPLLRKPSKFVPDKVKVGLIKIIGDLMHLIPDLGDRHSTAFQTVYKLLSHLFQTLHSRPARIGLILTFRRLAEIEKSLSNVAELLESLNAYSTKRLDEPDFARRLQAFTLLNEELYKTFSFADWIPVLHNILYCIQDADELAIRTNASHGMKCFIEHLTTKPSADSDHIFLTILYPGLKNGLRAKSELVRSEFLSVLSFAVEKCKHITSLQEMRVLLEGGDDEANFFNNVLHVQVHRRSRALRRLADHCDEGRLRISTIAEIFIPLIGNFIISNSTVDHHLVNDAILTTGRIAKRLSWGTYYDLVQKYLTLAEGKDGSERVYVRTLVALLNNFHFPVEELPIRPSVKEIDGEGEVAPDALTIAPSEVDSMAQASTTRIADAVNVHLLPKLLSFLQKDEPDIENHSRISISVGIVTVAMHLPTSARDAHISRLLTILSQMLRSRSQEMRDVVRDSLNRIAINLGVSYLPIICRELRTALIRGPQLHVLAHVIHSLIIHVTTGDHAMPCLDDCVTDVTDVSAEVIFGESGKDVQTEGFRTKTREVRGSSSRGLDCFAILAKHITPTKVSSLLAPVKAIMHETAAINVMGLIDEVLKRIATGLNGNQYLTPEELLTLCNTLISQNARFLQQMPPHHTSKKKNDVIVQIRRQMTSSTDHYANNSFRYVVGQFKFLISQLCSFVTLGLDLLNTAIKRNRFDFREASIIAKLEAIVAVVGDTLYSKNATVLSLGMRCIAGLSKCPLRAIENSISVVVRQILDIIKQIGSTESDLAQVALKSLATILRDGPSVIVKEKDLVHILELISPDLEEPSRQATIFNLLRAIVRRKFVVPEIYDLMESVSKISVTSQSTQVQELCRGVLLQFLLDYPQGKGRLRNQMSFFAKNLSYVYESGRTSIMELLSAVIVKFQESLIQEYAELLFVALVMVVANDESAKCREMAAQLIKTLWTRLDDERQKVLLSLLHTWASQTSQNLLAWVATQVYGFLLDLPQAESLPYVSSFLDDVKLSLQRSSMTLMAIHEDQNVSTTELESGWQMPYHSLTVLAKYLSVFPDSALDDEVIEWKYVTEHLVFPHAWVRTAASRLLGLLFNVVPVALPRKNLQDDHPLSIAGMRDVARKLTHQLKSEHLDTSLNLQIVKNLFHIGKCFDCIPLSDSTTVDEVTKDVMDQDEGGEPRIIDEGNSVLNNPLPWLFSTLSYQVVSAYIARRNRSSVKVRF